ncbi:RNA polymerase sigma factor [Ferruginibacter sp.]|uniref:RNA polymerase sigma factor n=1 Tax=Ferruginibacter sp. TaxID=1940288 RepID=UPI00199B7A1A|nr:sigma-70 family RNA polymerase sigma factor [Ferruginibacter sp.]MBC7627424.1 sigma-70 family RNA polymerase sigma factor [Ferruginibacter sp.]
MNQQDKFTNLYDEYGEGIKKLCLSYTGDAVLAQDLLQETFIAVWNNMQKFRADAKWSTWIYRIAVNTCLTHLRKKTAILVDIETTSLAMLPDDVNTKEQEVQLLYKSISQLQQTDRLIITLVLEDKPYDEIASITGITEANLRVKIHRIKKQLTQIYNSYAGL